MTAIDSPIRPDSRSSEQAQQVIDAVHRHFRVNREFFGEQQDIEFFVDPVQADTKTAFLDLANDLRPLGEMAILRRTDDEYFVKVFPRPVFPKSKSRTPILLLVATVVVIFLDGFLRPYLPGSLWGPAPPFGQGVIIAVAYTAALMGIIGIHETGHKIAAWFHRMEASWPYFLPGIPGLMPTFGAVINAREPPPNRDSLFDLGISGPIAGLIATIIVSFFAAASAQTVKMAPTLSYTNVDYWTTFLTGLLVRAPGPDYAITGTLFFLLYFAYTWGFLLTFVNLLPAWQLDGGHIANAAVSPKTHRYLTFISAGIMILIGFWLMGLAILFLSNKYPALTPLDNVSPLSRKRRVIFAVVWAIVIAIFILVIYNNYFFWPNPIFQL
jgi:Zn-dependent protease